MNKIQNSFLVWLRTRYIVIIRHHDNLEIKATFHLSKSDVIVIFVLFFIIIQTISIFLTFKVRQSWINPAYAEFQTKKKLLNLSEQLDSLTRDAFQKENYLSNIKNLVLEADTAKIKNIKLNEKSQLKAINLDSLSPFDSVVRKQIEKEYTELGYTDSRKYNELAGLYFFTPIKGIITSPFNAKSKHFGIDIVAKANEPAKAVLDGIIFLSTWTQDAGYTLSIQHKNNLISVYKHNSVNLKNAGDFVEAGEVVSIIGNTGEFSSGPHLHFELWCNGVEVNPQDYISF